MQYIPKRNLFKALFLTTFLISIDYNNSYAAIYYDDGQTHTYNDTVNITDTQPAILGYSSVASFNSKINFKKDVNINLQNQPGTYMPIVNVLGSAGTTELNIAGTLRIYADLSGSPKSTSAIGIMNYYAPFININNYQATIYGGDNARIIGGLGQFNIQNSNIQLYAINNTAEAYGYKDADDRRVALPELRLSGQHQINIDAVNGKILIGVWKWNDTPSVLLPTGSSLAININNNSNGSISWDKMSVRGTDAVLNMERGSIANIKMNMSTNNTFYDTTLTPTYAYKSLYTPAGVYNNPSIGGQAVISNLASGSSLNITVAGAPIWDQYDRYGAKMGIGSIVGLASLINTTINGDLNINVNSPKGVAVRIDDAAFVATPKIELSGNTIIKATNGYALMSESVIWADLSNRYLSYNTTTGTSSITINQNGGSLVQITGDLDHRSLRDSYFNINLDRPDSFLTGASYKTNDTTINYNGTIITPHGNTDIRVANAAAWNMTANSIVNNLTLESSGLLNLTANNSYKTLTTANLIGNTGKLLFNADLQASLNNKDVNTYSDRLLITTSSAGTHTINTKVQPGKLPSNGYLLLVEDRSQGAAQFVGGTVEKGGIFKYRPVITSTNPIDYSNVPANATNWYLTGFEKTGELNPDVYINFGLVESRYLAYMNEQDTLVKRRGELQQEGNQGLWARTRGANNSIDGLGVMRNSYTSMQLGYDWRIKGNSTNKRYIGLAFNHTNNNFDYIDNGNGQGAANVLTVYGTRLGDKGHYLDLVGKIGRISNNYKYKTSSSDMQNWFYSLSAEYGRNITRKNGWYYEPQAQFTLGRINGGSFTNHNAGITTSADAINSAILRAGILFGRKLTQSSKLNYYGKLFWSHEFGGNVKTRMSDIYDDTLDLGHSYSGSWLTAGLGTTVSLSNQTNLYLDVEKSFGSRISGGWSWQAGLRCLF